METNLKRCIEDLLVREMENMDDAEVYKYLVSTRPDGKIMLDAREHADFEKWLDMHHSGLFMPLSRFLSP